MTGYEESLLTRAEVLEDTGNLVQAITSILAGARVAGVDRGAVTSLAAAARALDPGAAAATTRAASTTGTPAADTGPIPSSSRPPPKPRAMC